MNTRNKSRSILGVIVAAFASRCVINTTNRFIYPFAPFISRGLGVPLTAVTSVIAVNQATSFLGLFTSPLGDRTGYRRMMLAGLGMLLIGMAVAGCFPFYYTLVVAMFLSGFGKHLFDPAIQAYVGNRVPWHRRGLVIGLLEISWAAATLAGIPLIGLILDRYGWRSPFWFLAGAAGLCIGLVAVYIADDSNRPGESAATASSLSSLAGLLTNRQALGAAGFGFCFSFANDNLFVIYGAWLEQAFGLSVVALGLGTGVIGVAELCGSSGTAVFSDRLGLKRAVAGGSCLCALAYGIIPVAGFSLTGALGGLFAVFLWFEFSIVSFLSMCTELVPGSRATMMSLFFASAGLGRVCGAFAGGFIWNALGMTGICAISSILTLAAMALFVWGTRRWVPEKRG